MIDFGFDFWRLRGGAAAFGAVRLSLVLLTAVGVAVATGPGGAAAQAAQAGQAGQTPSGAAPQTAVLGDTIRVGDVVPVAVRVTVAPGQRVAWPDTLPITGELVENAARVRERVDTLADGRLAVTALYAVTPWRTGEVTLPELSVEIVTGREVVRTLTASLPSMDVVSVLPADTAGLEPRPAKDVIGRNWSLWPILLALLALLALIGGILWWRRRRRAAGGARAVEPPIPPREKVLARLQEARESGLIEQGNMKEFYTRVSDALRDYLGTLGSGWSEDLTTTELLGRFRAQAGPEEARALGGVLRPADQVKFARRQPDAATAVREWEAARAWVLAFQWPPHRTVDDHEEAA